MCLEDQPRNMAQVGEAVNKDKAKKLINVQNHLLFISSNALIEVNWREKSFGSRWGIYLSISPKLAKDLLLTRTTHIYTRTSLQLDFLILGRKKIPVKFRGP